MFKRSTKLTALLVAAASVASTVPAMAATKLATKDGTIEEAVAYKDGKYLYQGYRTDDDDNGLYIGDGSEKDKMLDDADKFDEDNGKFGDKYISVKDGDDYYVVDIESGKISDEDTIEDLADTAKTKLENKLDDTDRYGDVEFKDEGKGTFGSDNTFKRVTNNKFEDVYYVYNVPGKQTLDNGGSSDAFGYTNDAGKYIDCSFDLNIYAYATTGASAAIASGDEDDEKKVSKDGKMYKIEDVNDTADAEGVKIAVKDIEFVKYIGQDDKNIYSIIKVELENAGDLSISSDAKSSSIHYYVQKVSKEQGDKEGDAYKPKSTECFEIAPKVSGEVSNVLGMGNGDVQDAYDALMADQTDKRRPTAGSFNNVKYAIVDGVIYASWEDETDKVKTFKIVLRTSEKLDRFFFNGSKNRDASKISGHVARKDGDKDHHMTEVEIDKNQPWTIDTNGTLWFIDEGKIYKSVKMGDFEEVYTCDRSLDSIDVYDENNLIAWDSDGDVYTTVGEGSAAAKDEAEDILGEQTTEPAVTVKTGWDQLADGTWNLYDATGAKVTGWANVGGVWYYMDPTTAVMRTGWVLDNGTWYYCNASGAMQTGWLNDNGTWYYLKANGAMATGWLQDTDGNWYYLNANGSMAANTTVDGYVLGANGAWIK